MVTAMEGVREEREAVEGPDVAPLISYYAFENEPVARRHYWEDVLTPLKAEEYKPKLFAVLDLETGVPGDCDPLGGTYNTGLGYWPDNGEFCPLDSVTDLADWVLSKRNRGRTIYAHNGHRYDYQYLVDYLFSRPERYPGVEVTMTLKGTGQPLLIKIKQHKHVVTLADTMDWLPMSLEKITETFSPELVKRPREWRRPDGSWNWFDKNNPADMAYLETDCKALANFIEHYRQTVYQTFGVNARLTATSTALAAWRRTIPEGTTYSRANSRVEDFLRPASRGGLVTVKRVGKLEDRVQPDVNAHYAAQCRKGVPDYSQAAYTRFWWGDQLYGTYRALVTVPEDEHDVFLFAENGPLMRGTFVTRCTWVELLEAERRGYPFTVIEGYVTSTLLQPFDIFIDKCEQLETEHRQSDGSQDAIGMAAKSFRNNLTGAFNKKPSSEERKWYADGLPDFVTPQTDPSTGDASAHIGVITRPLSRSYMQPGWYQTITANGRVVMSQLSKALDLDYTDTDGGIGSAANINAAIASGSLKCSLKYGDYKIEAEYDWVNIGGPKNYRGHLRTGKEKNRVKGIPRRVYSASDHDRALAGEMVTVETVGVAGMKRVAAGEAIQFTAKRSYSQLANSATWEVGKDGEVWARAAK